MFQLVKFAMVWTVKCLTTERLKTVLVLINQTFQNPDLFQDDELYFFDE